MFFDFDVGAGLEFLTYVVLATPRGLHAASTGHVSTGPSLFQQVQSEYLRHGRALTGAAGPDVDLTVE